MRAVIPFKKENAKSRLSSILEPHERLQLAVSMLSDVLNALEASSCFDTIDLLTTSVSTAMSIDFRNINIVVSNDGLNESLNNYLSQLSSHNPEPVLIIMADLPLVTKKAIRDICKTDAEILIVPGKKGGTNALFIRDPSKFHVNYYGASFIKHLSIAKENGLAVEIFDSFLMSTDIDEPDDLLELMIHGSGRAADYLCKILRIKIDGKNIALERKDIAACV